MQTITEIMIWVYFIIGVLTLTGLIILSFLWFMADYVIAVLLQYFKISKLLIEYAKEHRTYQTIKQRGLDLAEIEALLKLKDEIKQHYEELKDE